MTNQLAIRDEMPLGDLGIVLVKSGFFGDTKDAAQAVVKVLAGRELGFGPIASMTGVNIIKGRVSLSANLIASAIKRTGRYNYRIVKLTDKECDLIFFEHGQEVGHSTFTAEDAKRAGLSGDNWNKYPRNMNFARAISNGAKWYCPDVFGGPIYTPDELGAVVDGETGEVIDMPAVDMTQPANIKPTNGKSAQGQAPDEPPVKELPTQEGWNIWNGLVAEARELGVEVTEPVDPTLNELRAAYKELQAGVKAAKAAQA